jgi:hypothetical protein
MVGGAAYYAGRKVAQGEQREAEQNAAIQDLQAQQQYGAPPPQYAPPPPQYAAPQQQYAAPPPQYAPAIDPSPAAAPAAEGKSPTDQIMDLKKLLDAGALTQEEFDFEKTKILRSL